MIRVVFFVFAVFCGAVLSVSAVLSSADTPDVVLTTWDGAKGTTYEWSDKNDPVGGGRWW